MAGRDFRETASSAFQADLAKWWPIAFVGPTVVAIRFSGPVQRLGVWAWIPVGLVLLVQLLLRRRQPPLSLGTAIFGAFVVYTTLSLAWSPDPMRGSRFVGSMAVAFIAYLFARNVSPPGGSSEMSRVSAMGLGLAVGGFLLLQDPGPVDHLNPDRILAMGVIALVVGAWYGPRSRFYTFVIGMTGFGLALASGSRMAALVATVLLLTAPGLRLPRAGRFLLAGGLVVLLLALSITPWFQNRWFTSGEGGIWELVTFQGVDTSGRFDIWPEISDSCTKPVFGQGAGAADSYGFEINQGFPEPHNEYLRIWCDTGLVGTLLFWSFIAVAAIAAMRGVQTRRHAWASHASLQLIAALLLLSLTDNPLTTVVPVMIPTALAFGWAEQAVQQGRDGGRHATFTKTPGILRENDP